MACRTPAADSVADASAVQLVKKTAELKKKLLLSGKLKLTLESRIS